MSHFTAPRFATLHLVTLGALLSACAEPSGVDGDWGDTGDSGWPDWTEAYSSCAPQMVHFPVGDAHNIGYDHASCGSGTCDISCPDDNANSDWGGRHHGIDIFAYQGAPLTAVATGEIVAVGTVSATSGLRVRLRDACGWEYYYGHMDEADVEVGDHVQAGDVIGTMGYTGAASTHLHFNVSYDGDYSNDINPFSLLESTSHTACEEPNDYADADFGSITGGSSSSGGSSDGGGSSSGGSSDGGSSSSGGSSDGGSSSGSTSSGSSSSGSSSSGSTSSGSSSSGSSSSSSTACGSATGTTYFWAGDLLTSCDGRFSLVMQGDGNLVLYQNGGSALWSTSTHGNSGAWAAMQTDGNLVVYSSGGSALWASGTQSYPGAELVVQGDGNLVIYDGSSAVWATGTSGN